MVVYQSFCAPLLKLFVLIPVQLSVPARVKMEEHAQLQEFAPALLDGLESTVNQVCTWHRVHSRNPSARNRVLDNGIVVCNPVHSKLAPCASGTTWRLTMSG